VFSGGDDLCIIGAWDKIMHFAADFRENFSKFTNYNPSVTLSGGIAMFSPSLPVRSAAAMAEDALHDAKNRKKEDKNEDEAEDDDPLKDGISAFGVTASWKDYGESLINAKEIVGYMEEKQGKKPVVSSAVVYKMIDFANRAQSAKKGNMRDMVWRSNYRYIISRNIDPEEKEALKFFLEFGAGSDDIMINSRIAVSYALYANRKVKEEDDGKSQIVRV
jgi:CRISPR-associated protein Csm1